MKSLLFSSIGSSSVATRWLAGEVAPEFDTWLVAYEPTRFPEGARTWERRGGKFDNFLWCWRRYRSEIDRYDAVLLLDDDMLISTAGLNRLFRTFHENKLALAQPAYSRDSQISWRLNRRDPFCTLRFSSFVECGAPIFSRSALRRCVDSFALSPSGMALDFIWPHLLDYPTRAIAILDDVFVTHRRRRRAITEAFSKSAQRRHLEEVFSHYGTPGRAPRVTEKLWQPSVGDLEKRLSYLRSRLDWAHDASGLKWMAQRSVVHLPSLVLRWLP